MVRALFVFDDNCGAICAHYLCLLAFLAIGLIVAKKTFCVKAIKQKRKDRFIFPSRFSVANNR